MRKDEAEAATRIGAIVACLSAGFTTLFILWGSSTGTHVFGKNSPNPMNFLDVSFSLAWPTVRIASHVWRQWRYVIYYVFNIIVITVERESVTISGTVVAFGIASVFLVVYGKAVKGAFVYQRILTEEGIERRPVPKWVYAVCAVLLTPLLGLLGLGLLAICGVLPALKVLSASEISADDISTLRAEGILLAEEEVEYFYSFGFFSILEGGNLLTRDAIISYVTDDSGTLQVRSIPKTEIVQVVRLSEGDAFNDGIYMVYGVRPDQWLKLELPTPENGGQSFVEALPVELAVSY